MAGVQLHLSKTHEIEEVPDLEVERTRITPVKDEKTGKHLRFDHSVIKIKGGFMAYFPNGHSTFFESEAKLREAGLELEPKLVNLATGEEVPEDFLSIKSLVASKTRSRGKVK